MSQRTLPAGPEEITPEWCTAVLRENTIISAGAVVDVQTDIIGQDWGFTGVIARVQLQYASHEENAPSSVVIKFPTSTRDTPSGYRSMQQQDVTTTRRYFERCAREVMFYQQIAPLGFIPVPRLYYGAADEATGRVILMLEDLHTARSGNALSGCSPQDAALVIDRLATFHAQWWNHPHLETFSWLPLWGGDPLVAQNRYGQLVEPFLQRFGHFLSQPVREIIDALVTNYGAVRSRLQQAPATMIHSDLHLDNILFPPLEHEPSVTVIDWQSVARGCGTIDLALFLFGSLETTTRRTVEENLLRRYHQLLVAGGVPDYSFPQLMEDCRLVLLWLLGAKVVWLGSAAIESLGEREQALMEASVMGGFTTVLDHDAGSLLPL